MSRPLARKTKGVNDTRPSLSLSHGCCASCRPHEACRCAPREGKQFSNSPTEDQRAVVAPRARRSPMSAYMRNITTPKNTTRTIVARYVRRCETMSQPGLVPRRFRSEPSLARARERRQRTANVLPRPTPHTRRTTPTSSSLRPVWTSWPNWSWARRSSTWPSWPCWSPPRTTP